MKHNYLNNMPLDEAKQRYAALLKEKGCKFKTEKVPVVDACNRVTAKAVYAKICSPHYNASAMDGIALNAADTYGCSESCPVKLSKEKYTVVDTGDALPDGCDCVAMVEDVSFDEEGFAVLFSALHPWQNVRQVGEDICMGDMIAASFEKITPQLCGAFLAGGITEVECIKRPFVGIIPTGDEIVAPTSNPAKGEIIEFNSTIFSGMIKQWGADSIVYGIVCDKKELLREAAEKAVKECDMVLILAGSSAGRDDYTCSIIESMGEVAVHGIAIKPGKPAVLGCVDDVPVVGLPGYPVSAIVVMREIVRDVLLYIGAKGESSRRTAKAVLGKKVVSSLKYEEFIRVTLGKVGQCLTAVPLSRGAGVVTSFTKASGILRVPQNCEGYEAGETVEIELLKPLDEIESALIVTGSHDPLIDEISDMLKTGGYGFSLVSSHVGSMGAISAIKNKQAHLGGIHLLDTETGAYNESYVKKYFPDGGVKLVKGVGRIQGLMVKKGNPLKIESFRDIVKGRYVNRQLGSGTRILCDYLLKENGMDKRDVQGYRNEEFTHTAVAALIAEGNADCGLGIYSAAKMYGLDFIEICIEQYDFLVDAQSFDTPEVKAFLSATASENFKKRLDEMGGYKL